MPQTQQTESLLREKHHKGLPQRLVQSQYQTRPTGRAHHRARKILITYTPIIMRCCLFLLKVMQSIIDLK